MFSRLTSLVFTLSALPSTLFDSAPLGRRQRNTCLSSLAQTDCHSLLWGPCAMLSLTYMLNLLMDELSCGGRRRLPLFKISSRSPRGCLFWHSTILLSSTDARFAQRDVRRASCHNQFGVCLAPRWQGPNRMIWPLPLAGSRWSDSALHGDRIRLRQSGHLAGPETAWDISQTAVP